MGVHSASAGNASSNRLLPSRRGLRVRVAVRAVPEVCRIYCATANPTQVIVAQTELGRGVLGVVDGASPSGVETDADIAWRKDLLRKLGYKL
jgi:uncharacterized protein